MKYVTQHLKLWFVSNLRILYEMYLHILTFCYYTLLKA